MNFTNAGIVYRKELKDSLRDRRTIISMVVVPIIIFPLLTVGMSYLATQAVNRLRLEVPRIVIRGGADAPQLVAALHSAGGFEFAPDSSDTLRRLREKEIQAVLVIPPGFDAAVERGQPEQVGIQFFEGDLRSSFARRTLEQILSGYRDRIVRRRLEARGLSGSVLEPFAVQATDVVPTQSSSIRALGGLVPYLVILLCLTGAMYPAMDLTAGEKERGTMETILTSPVSRTDLVIGKFWMVLTASLATATLSVASMAFSFHWAHAHSAGLPGGENPFSASLGPSSIAAVILMVLPLSVLFSAVLITVALFAKSYREAQSYVTPLTFIVVIPAVASLLPGVELNSRTALVPILSTSLVSREIVSGNHPWGYIAIVFATSCVYAVFALWLAVRMFNREDVLFRT